MQVVSGIESREQLVGMFWVAHGSIKVDYRVEVTGSANPLVDGLPVGLGGWTGMIVQRADKGQERGANDLDLVRMGPGDDLLIGRLHAMHLRLVRGLRYVAVAGKHAQIVDPLQNHQATNARLRQDIVIEAGQSVGPKSVE